MPGRDPNSCYYALLGLYPSASAQEIRRAYRELSKLYHPDTTELPGAIATAKFQQLNEAYATLSSPERRTVYDLKMGHSRVSVIRPPADLNRPVSESRKSRSSGAYLEPTERPLSAGEVFALFILGLTFVACLLLVVTVGMTRDEVGFQTLNPINSIESILHQSPEPRSALSEEWVEPLQTPQASTSDSSEDSPTTRTDGRTSADRTSPSERLLATEPAT
jgi:DnaJ domain